MNVDVLIFARSHNYFTDSNKVSVALRSIYFMFLTYISWLLFFFVCNCYNSVGCSHLLQYSVACCVLARVNSLETDTNLLYDFLLTFGVYLFDWICSRSYCRLYVFGCYLLGICVCVCVGV